MLLEGAAAQGVGHALSGGPERQFSRGLMRNGVMMSMIAVLAGGTMINLSGRATVALLRGHTRSVR